MTMEAPISPEADECYRCGYLLHGIADDQACPECGLLAIRSRRVTDELHETRPKWLRSLFLGVALILLSLAIPVMWTIVSGYLRYLAQLQYYTRHRMQIRVAYADYILVRPFMELIDGRVQPFSLLVGWVVFYSGVLLLTSRERYEPADRADKRLRILLRCAAIVPLLAICLLFLRTQVLLHQSWKLLWNSWWEAFVALGLGATITATLGVLPLPILLFLRLRQLAKRAHSAHLAEHCMIVGIGTSLSLLYSLGVDELFERAGNLSLFHGRLSNSTVWLILALGVGVAAGLFIIWSMYLMIRFAVAFLLASRRRSRNWRRDDRSLPVPAQP